jgi:hypothetical protein
MGASMLRFDETPTNAARALQCYLLLIGCARRRETMTYKQLRELLGYDRGAEHTMGDRLAPLHWWCQSNGLPALTSLVVNEETGLPGIGFYAAADVPREQQRVFAYEWHRLYPPEVQRLEEERVAGVAQVKNST